MEWAPRFCGGAEAHHVDAARLHNLRDRSGGFDRVARAAAHERAQLVSDGAIPALVTLTREPDVVTKMSCALALMNLAAEPELRAALGAIFS